MKLDVEQLAQRLAAELGADTVTTDPSLLASHGVDNKQPSLLLSPATTEQIAVAIRICGEAEAAVTPRGGGTAMRIGNLPRQVDAVITTARLNRVSEHDHANLTATVQSGIALATLQDALAPQKQFLPIDPPFFDRTTIGGIVAANLNGPRRSSYGSVRDLVIGMKVALGSGEHIKAGGKVVKNVAGYDMCKLFVGSLGTLGIITEVTLRMAPVPETAATLAASGTLLRVLQFAEDLSRSSLLPAAVVILDSHASGVSEVAQTDWQVAVWSEGFEDSVKRHLRDAQEMADRAGLKTAVLRAQAHRQFWHEIHDFPLRPDRLVYRATVPRVSVAELIKTVHGWPTAELHAAMVSDAAMGTVWISLDANDAGATWFSKIIAAAREQRGNAVMLAAPPGLKEGVDVWGPAPPALSLMREIKQQFDPKGLLNPGRFLAGI